MTLHTITNANGRTFNVRLVATGERYGREDCLVHDRAMPLVEFYDASRPSGACVQSRGQFVSRYYFTDLMDPAILVRGLDLQGDVPEWKLDAAAFADAWRWLRDQATRKVGAR